MPQGAICSGALGKMAPLIITARKGHNTRTAAGEKVPVYIWCPPGGYNTRTAAAEPPRKVAECGNGTLSRGWPANGQPHAVVF